MAGRGWHDPASLKRNERPRMTGPLTPGCSAERARSDRLPSGSVDGDALDLTLRLGAFFQRDRQHAAIEGGLHLLRVDFAIKLDRARELAVPALAVGSA